MRSRTLVAGALASWLVLGVGFPAHPQQGLILAPEEALPERVRRAPTPVREAYRFALANPHVLRKIPCYCSCETWGHGSNYDCYAGETREDGSVPVEDHGLG